MTWLTKEHVRCKRHQRHLLSALKYVYQLIVENRTTFVVYCSVECKMNYDVCISENFAYILVTVLRNNLSSDLYCCSSSYSWTSCEINKYIYIYISINIATSVLLIQFDVRLYVLHVLLKPNGGVCFIATLRYIEVFSNKFNLFHTKKLFI